MYISIPISYHIFAHLSQKGGNTMRQCELYDIHLLKKYNILWRHYEYGDTIQL